MRLRLGVIWRDDPDVRFGVNQAIQVESEHEGAGEHLENQ